MIIVKLVVIILIIVYLVECIINMTVLLKHVNYNVVKNVMGVINHLLTATPVQILVKLLQDVLSVIHICTMIVIMNVKIVIIFVKNVLGLQIIVCNVKISLKEFQIVQNVLKDII